MITKTVYSYDPATGSFLGTITLDAGDLSPLDLAEGREVWMVPGNCLEVAPPADVPAGKYAAAEGGAWVIKDVPVPIGVQATKERAAALAERMLTPQDHAGMLQAWVQQGLDALARAVRFSSMDEAATYLSSSVPKFRAQAMALIAVRDATWEMVEPMLDDIAAGKIEPVKVADLAPKLPIYDALKVEADTKALEEKRAADAVAATASEQEDDAPAVVAAPAPRKAKQRKA